MIDYFEKNPHASNEQIIDLLNKLSEAQINEKKKGLLFEQITCLYLKKIEGFIAERKKGHDVLIKNNSQEGPLKGIFPIILVECKYKMNTLQINEISPFAEKIRNVRRFRPDVCGIFFTKSPLANSEKVSNLLYEHNIIVIKLEKFYELLENNTDFKKFLFDKMKFW